MAVMTSLPEHTVLGDKAAPVPSADKMALDLGINGSAIHDHNSETSPHDPTLFPSKTNDTSDVDASITAVNGDHNTNALAVNSAIEISHDLSSAQTENAPLVGGIAGEVNKIPTEDAQPRESTNNNAISPPVDSATPTVPDAAQTALDATTTVPPVISAPESDLREDPLSVTQEEAVTLQEAKPDCDLRDETEIPDVPVSSAAIEQPQPSSLDTSTESVDLLPSSDPLKPASLSNLDLNTNNQSQPVSVGPPTTEHPQEDTDMADAPLSSSTKVSRDREDDIEDEPSAKRTKLQDDVKPEVVPAPQNGISEQTTSPHIEIEDDGPLTPYQTKEIGKALRSVKSTKDGKNFKAAVVDLWPGLKDSYLAVVENPIDLSLIEQKAKAGYSSMADYVKDVELLYANCVTFNKVDHDVTRSAVVVRDSLLSKLPSKEPPKVEKKKKSTPVPSTQRNVPERRQSRGAQTGKAGSPTTSGASQTFALDPSGTPLIRRDSTKTGDNGRPKREIHPPKSKDLIYNNRPKKRKFATELKFCEEVLNELKKPKYQRISSAFSVPVDPVALGIPEYFKIIKTPMDLSLITENLNNGQYGSAKDFENDIRLMFRNCYKFNPPGSHVYVIGQELEAIFDAEWSRKARYIAEHTVSSAATPDSSAESADDESEEEEPEEDHSTSAAGLIQKRLVEEQRKLIEIMSMKKVDQTLVHLQQEMVAIVQKQVDELAKRTAASSKKSKAKPSKKAAAGKKNSKAAKTKGYRVKQIGFAEKEQISNGIAQLDGKPMDMAIQLLKKDLPNLDLENNPELDIDQFSNATLSHLHDLIQKYAPHCIPAPEPRAPRPQKPVKPKKNKPMGKDEQEKKIDHLRQLHQQFKRQGSSEDAKVVPSVEQDMSSSGDESPSDSEED